MQTKARLILYTIVTLMIIAIIIGCICCQCEDKVNEEEIIERTVENKITIEIETDKGGRY